MADQNAAPRPKPKIDRFTLIVYIIISVIILFVCLLLGAAFDYSLSADGKIDINKVGKAVDYLLRNPANIFAALSKKGSYAPKMLFLAFMVIGIFALYKYSEEKKRLHRRGTEHGSAKWGDLKEMQSLADKTVKPKLMPIKVFDKLDFLIEWNKPQKWKYENGTFTLLSDNGDLILSFQIVGFEAEKAKEKDELQKAFRLGTEFEITEHTDKKQIGQHCRIQAVSGDNTEYHVDAISTDGHRVFDHDGNFIGVMVDNNILLTKEVLLSLNAKQHLLNFNVLIIGGSGSGKTRFFAKPNIMQLNTSYVVTDPKGEILQSTGKMLTEAGYTVRVFNTIEMQHSNNYNPFHYVYDRNGEVNEDDVKKMVDVLFKSTKGDGEKDDFWSQKGQSALEAFTFLLFEESEYNAEFTTDINGVKHIIPETRDETNLNFFAITEKMRKLKYPPQGQADGYFLTKSEGESDAEFEARRGKAFLCDLDKDFIELERRKPDSLALRLYKEIRNAPEETGQSFLSSANVKTFFFNLKNLRNLTCCDNIHLETLGDEKTALFIIISATNSTYNFLAAMMYTQLFDVLSNRANFVHHGKLPIHVRCIMDEFANIGQIPDFDQKIAFVRSMNISLNVIIQNLAQLKSKYEKTWEVITGNCDSLLFLGGQEESTLKSISERLGKETIDVRGTNRTKGKSPSTSENNSIMGRELMQPNEIATMPISDCILMIRSHNPFYCKKYPIEQHPNYKYLEDANPDNAFDVHSIHSITFEEFAAVQIEKRKHYAEQQQSIVKLKKEEQAESDTPVNEMAETGDVVYAEPFFSTIGDLFSGQLIPSTFAELEDLLEYADLGFSVNIGEEVFADDEPRFGAEIGEFSSFDLGELSEPKESEVIENVEETSPLPSVIEEDGSITEPDTSEETEEETEIHYDSNAVLPEQPESYDDLNGMTEISVECEYTESFADLPETEDFNGLGIGFPM